MGGQEAFTQQPVGKIILSIVAPEEETADDLGLSGNRVLLPAAPADGHQAMTDRAGMSR